MRITLAMRVNDLNQPALEFCTMTLKEWTAWHKPIPELEAGMSILYKAFPNLVRKSDTPLYRIVKVATSSWNALRNNQQPIKMLPRTWISSTTSDNLHFNPQKVSGNEGITLLVQLPNATEGFDMVTFIAACSKRIQELQQDVKSATLIIEKRRKMELEMLTGTQQALSNFLPSEKEWVVPGSALEYIDSTNFLAYRDANGSWIRTKLTPTTNSPVEETTIKIPDAFDFEIAEEDLKPKRVAKPKHDATGNFSTTVGTKFWTSADEAEHDQEAAPSIINGKKVTYVVKSQGGGRWRIDVYHGDNRIGYWTPPEKAAPSDSKRAGQPQVPAKPEPAWRSKKPPPPKLPKIVDDEDEDEPPPKSKPVKKGLEPLVVKGKVDSNPKAVSPADAKAALPKVPTLIAGRKIKAAITKLPGGKAGIAIYPAGVPIVDKHRIGWWQFG